MRSPQSPPGWRNQVISATPHKASPQCSSPSSMPSWFRPQLSEDVVLPSPHGILYFAITYLIIPVYVKQSNIHCAAQKEAFNTRYFDTPSHWLNLRLQIIWKQAMPLESRFLNIEGIWIYAVNCFPALMLCLCPVKKILHPFTSISFNAMTQKLVQCNGSPEQKKNWP